MKRLIAMILAAMMLLTLAACGSKESDPQQQITQATKPAQEQTEEATQPEATEDAPAATIPLYSFSWENYTVVPGLAFDPAQYPEAESVYQVPSCAVEGTDNVYNYGTFEVTAFEENGSETVYSVFLADPNLKTAEGLSQNDSRDKVIELYGDSYTEEGTAMIYTSGSTALYILVENDTVVSIEYRYVAA